MLILACRRDLDIAASMALDGSNLPVQLRHRLRVLRKPGSSGTAGGSGHVLYWMRSALRAHENPCLDAAVLAAAALQTALIVVLHVEDRYPQATARRQKFILEGAREAQAELAARGVRNVVMQIDRHAGSSGIESDLHLQLAKTSALVVAEEPFCVPWLQGIEQLMHEPDISCPVWVIDASSVVPCALVPKGACHRAYAYEKATQQLHEDFLARPWEDIALPPPCAAPVEKLPSFIDLKAENLEDLIEQMDVDKSVRPVQHTIGGSSAGYARWSSWLAAGGLSTYAARRNDALDVNGVSRMSAYLNLGMVSPMRIAREAKAARGAGKGKFLNEFLTWRGLSLAYCYHFPMPASGATLSQLPTWARQTLLQHAGDPRQSIPLRNLRSGESGNAAWDGMQRYLNQTGELHNNARMGWGKAILKWTRSPEEALEVLLDLNNRFALDGHSPPSYGGLLGCLGLFEGPKQEGMVHGKVSFKPPKSKYAVMRDTAKQLLQLVPTVARQGENLGIRGHLTRGMGVTQTKRQTPEIVEQLPASCELFGPNVAGDVQNQDKSASKRRWTKKLATTDPGITCIDID